MDHVIRIHSDVHECLVFALLIIRLIIRAAFG